MPNQEESTEARLERLERRCRRLTLGVVALATILATACLSSAMREEPRELRAKRIVLLRDDGQPGILLEGELPSNGGCQSGAGIFLYAGDADASSSWMVGRFKQDESETWHDHATFALSAGWDRRDENSGSSVSLWANDLRGGVRVSGVLREAAIETEADRASLRFLEVDQQLKELEEENEEDEIRLSLEVVGGAPALRAVDEAGETRFELP